MNTVYVLDMGLWEHVLKQNNTKYESLKVPSDSQIESAIKIYLDMINDMINQYGQDRIKSIPPVYGKPGCDHVWAKYQGFSEEFEFCKTCDEKKDVKNV